MTKLEITIRKKTKFSDELRELKKILRSFLDTSIGYWFKKILVYAFIVFILVITIISAI